MNTRLTNGELQDAIDSACRVLANQQIDPASRITMRVHFERLVQEQRDRAIGLAKECDA